MCRYVVLVVWSRRPVLSSIWKSRSDYLGLTTSKYYLGVEIFLDRIFRSFAYCKEFRLFAQVHLVRACGLRVYKIKIV